MTDELKTPAEWSKLKHTRILDPDGWRPPHNDKKLDEPITEKEFLWRWAISTVMLLPDDSA